MNHAFVPLGLRTDFSPADSIATAAQLCRVASRHGMQALAVCDTMSLAGIPAVVAAARTAGIRPLLGMEAVVLPREHRAWCGEAFRLRLLASTTGSWARLVQLVNLGHGRATDGAPAHLLWDEILAETDGLVVIAGGLHCELTAAVRTGKPERAGELIAAARERLTTEQFFLALPHPARGDGAERCAILRDLAEEHELPMLALPEVRYAWREDALAWEFFHGLPKPEEGEAIRRPKTFGELAKRLKHREHLAPCHEFAEAYEGFPGAAENTAAVAELCALDLPRPRRRFPVHEFERGVDAESYIWNTVFSTASERYGNLPTKWRERLNREFRDLVEADLADALICLARLEEEFRERGLVRGPGAGFLTSSLVASLLGITRVDPVAFDLPFALPESSERATACMQFAVPESQLDEATEALQGLFANHVAAVGKWKRWTPQACLERVMEQMGRRNGEAGRIAKTAAWKSARQEAMIESGTGDPPEDMALAEPAGLAWLVHRLEGRARSLRATGGMVFTSGTASRMLPCATGDGAARASEWEADALEELGFGRIALRTNPMLDLIEEAVRWAREQGNSGFDPLHAPPEDDGAFGLLREGRTLGVPLFESPSLRARLRSSPPGDVKELLGLLAELNGGAALPSFEDVSLSLGALIVRAREKTAYFAAALSQAAGDKGRTAALLEAARREGIGLRPLDLNCSVWRWAPEGNALRPGFQVVHGFTESAARELEWVRREMTYNDLADLLRRTDPRYLKTPQIETLIRAGALDSLAPSRAGLLEQLPELEELLRPRRARKQASDDPLAFFGLGSDWWLQNQAPESVARIDKDDDPMWLASQEVANTGILFSFGPEELHRDFLKTAGVCAPAKLSPRDRDSDITICGVIEGIAEGIGHKGGRVLLAEVAGCLVEFSGWPARFAAEAAIEGRRILVAGRATRPATQWHLAAELVVGLNEAAERADRAELLEIVQAPADAKVLKQVLALLKRFSGYTPVQVVAGLDSNRRLLNRIGGRKVTLCPGLELGLARLLAPGTWRISVPGEEAETEAASADGKAASRRG